jgi:hypothetical protein
VTKLAEQVLEILRRYVGDGMARALVHAAAGESRVDFEGLGAGELPRLLDVVDRHLGTYLRDGDKRERCMRELRHAGPHLAPTPSIDALMIIPLLREEDVLKARGLCRKLTIQLGFSEDRQPVVVAGVVDLATELLRRGQQGTIVFRKLASPAGVEVTAFERAKAGGSSLGQVRVKADAFVVESPPNMGTTLRASWYLKAPSIPAGA